MSDEINDGRGRPTKYNAEFCETARSLCKAGALDVDLANEFGVSVATIFNWRAKYPEFLEATKRGKDVADDAVERALFNRATGYSHDAVKIVVVDKSVEKVEYIEHYPPDTAAAFIWLKNRRRNKWKNNPELFDIDPDMGNKKYDFSKLPPEKRQLLREMFKLAEIENDSDVNEKK